MNPLVFRIDDGREPVQVFALPIGIQCHFVEFHRPSIESELQVEFSPEEWASRAVGDEPIVLHHGVLDCDGSGRCVFVCRGPHGCGRYCCACCGGDGDKYEKTICDECWCKYQDKKGGAA